MIFNGTLSVNVIKLNSILLFTILVIFLNVFSGMYIEMYPTFAGTKAYVCTGAKQYKHQEFPASGF